MKNPPVPSPAAGTSSSPPGSAAAVATPAATPTAESRALETVTGTPTSAATASRRRGPPSGATLTTARSAPPARTTRSGSSARRIDSSAATSTSTPSRSSRARNATSSSTVAHGCSRPRGAAPGRVRRPGDRPPAVGVHTDPRPRARLENGGDTGHVVDELLPLLGDFDLDRGAAREPLEDARHLSGRDRRDRGVDRDAAAPGRRRAPPPHLERGPQPVDRLRVRILGEGPELPPAGRALDQRHLALGDAPEPHVHRQRHHVHPPEKIVDRVGARNGCHGSTLTSDP